MLAHSITKTNITLNTDKYVTVIATQHAVNQSSEYKDAHYVGIAFVIQTVVCFCVRVS